MDGRICKKKFNTIYQHFSFLFISTYFSFSAGLCAVLVGLGGLGLTRSLPDQMFAGSNPAEVDGFFQDVKILSTSPPGGTVSRGPESEISNWLKNLKREKISL